MTEPVRTLEDLASHTGISRSTISRVLNGGSVAESTKQAVLDAIEATGYRPHRAARTLASGRTGVIGVVFHEPVSRLFNDPYFGQLLQGIGDELRSDAAGLMLYLSHANPEETVTELRSTGHVDGVVVTATYLEDPVVDAVIALGLPAVLIGRRPHDDASYVDIDNADGAQAVVRHLVARGRRRIAHVTGTRGTVSGEDRLAGYLAAMAEAQLQPLVEEGLYSPEPSTEAAVRLAEAGADAIFLGNDTSALAAIGALTERGYSVPSDVAIVGFDDIPEAAASGLTTVRQRIHDQGAVAIQTLQRLIANPDEGPHRVMLPTELIVRLST